MARQINPVSNIDRDRQTKSNSYESPRSRIARKNLEQRKRRTVVFSAVLAPMLACLVLVMSLSIQSRAGEEHEVYKYYKSVEVASGDTLWTIADKYMGEGSFDKRDYIEEVKELNHMYSDDISAGEYLVVPFYSAELR